MTEPTPASDFDVNEPSLDRGHEAIRLAVIDAIASSQQNCDLLNTVVAAIADHETRLAALETPTP